MQIILPKGLYVAGISGGVDSMVLLDLLYKNKVRVVVAHFDHAIRDDSYKDEKLVRKAAKAYGFDFETGKAKVGQINSEESARSARYKFLDKVQKKFKADYILTAHHEDDLIETAFINLLRGTGPKGLYSIATGRVKRPLLKYSKAEILKYAAENKIKWREDSTNSQDKYLRNYIRLHISPRLEPQQKKQLLQQVQLAQKTSHETDKIIATISGSIKTKDKIQRGAFSSLPSSVGDELVAYWLRSESFSQFDRPTVHRLSNALRTARPGTSHEVSKNISLFTGLKEAHFSRTV